MAKEKLWKIIDGCDIRITDDRLVLGLGGFAWFGRLYEKVFKKPYPVPNYEGKFYNGFPYLFKLGKCTIFIKKGNEQDEALLKHELTHYHQHQRDNFYGLNYVLSRKKRLQYEIEAYFNQLEEQGLFSIENLGSVETTRAIVTTCSYLHKDYNLNMELDKIKKEFLNYIQYRRPMFNNK